ncbi:MAG: FAD-dependent oxidoreductase [Desulfobacteraceae bacterium]|nr:MAG: FAD-dependent oxidoreductase [Desulfobacteraceae bacterium]
MHRINHFTLGVRVANFSGIALPFDHLLEFDTADTASIIKKIRKYADLPYVFVVSNEKAAQIPDVLSALEAIRSPCLPYALFAVGDVDLRDAAGDLEVVRIDKPDAVAIRNRIDEYAAARLHFNEGRLRVESTGSLPETVDVVIVGGGIIGLYAANRLKQSGISFCVVEKNAKVGGIWSNFANATSRVNSSECAYRLLDTKTRSNRDHSATREILEDIAVLADRVADHLYLQTEVERIEKKETRYHVQYRRNERTSAVQSKGVILAINDRVGAPRKTTWANQEAFQGDIVAGIADQAAGIEWRNKKVVVVGMGAFAVENVRTALEGGARHVTVLCRRHGTVCPKIIDYLNFVTPYDEAFKHDKKSNFRNMMYWKKTYEMSGATEPECWMGKVKHDGHTISVSDLWFVGHYLKKIETITGQVSGLFEHGVIVDGRRRIDADIVANCIGFERNASVAKALCGYADMYNNNYVDKDFMYLADAHIDDDAFNSFFGSSVLEMAKFYMEVYIRHFDSPRFSEMLATEGIEKIPIADRKWSHYIAGATALIRNHPEIRAIALKQVAQRTSNFLEKHDIETYIEENKREWMDMHALLAGQPVKEEYCLPYVFEKLLPKRGQRS